MVHDYGLCKSTPMFLLQNPRKAKLHKCPYPDVFELRRGPLHAYACMQWVMFYLKGAGIKLKADSAG